MRGWTYEEEWVFLILSQKRKREGGEMVDEMMMGAVEVLGRRNGKKWMECKKERKEPLTQLKQGKKAVGRKMTEWNGVRRGGGKKR
jgi:hypothetical protein